MPDHALALIAKPGLLPRLRRSCLLGLSALVAGFAHAAAPDPALPLPASAAASSSTPSAAPVFLMGTETFENSYVGIWLRLVYAEAFKRLGVPYRASAAPLKRVDLMAETGRIDGDMSRAPAYGAAHPEMIAVDFSLQDVVFSIYATRPIEAIKRIEDLQASSLHGVYTRGTVFCENLMKTFPEGRVTAVTSIKNGLAMLGAAHAGFLCASSSSVLNYQNSVVLGSGVTLVKLFDLGAPVPLRPYLLKKHAALAPQLAETLRRMKAEGLLEQYWVEAKVKALAAKE
ncbi:hypothetical protein WG899_00480 [Paucibacter sp. AS339]|uniref:hypothetical protein n=1 Tax=Paucibacter hankyongi TaxID=3133434 RepID=UPI0030B63E6B